MRSVEGRDLGEWSRPWRPDESLKIHPGGLKGVERNFPGQIAGAQIQARGKTGQVIWKMAGWWKVNEQCTFV